MGASTNKAAFIVLLNNMQGTSVVVMMCTLLNPVNTFLPSARGRGGMISSCCFPPDSMALAKSADGIEKAVVPGLDLCDEQLLVASCDSSFSCC